MRFFCEIEKRTEHQTFSPCRFHDTYYHYVLRRTSPERAHSRERTGEWRLTRDSRWICSMGLLLLVRTRVLFSMGCSHYYCCYCTTTYYTL